jgi:hypothetical protein
MIKLIARTDIYLSNVLILNKTAKYWVVCRASWYSNPLVQQQADSPKCRTLLQLILSVPAVPAVHYE